MDASDMGLPDDELLKRLKKLVETGFDFEDLLSAEAERAALIGEMSEVIEDHGPREFRDMKLPVVRMALQEIPELVDLIISSGFHHPGAAASLVIRFTNIVRNSSSVLAKQKVQELIAAMIEDADQDLTIKLVGEVCQRELI